MQRTFESITKSELESKVKKAFKANKDEYASILDLTKRISRDLQKVHFDSENIEYESSNQNDFLGYNVLSNGMPYLGAYAGGDWEWPVYFIIYWDGKKLRAYIPKEGNLWNTQTKEAYGNDDETDLKNFKERFPDFPVRENINDIHQVFDLQHDFDAMRKEIQERIIKSA